tara:strand:- start:347 stop:1174 length:828 start_codon:yes stop_codon:yes gene_type:complete
MLKKLVHYLNNHGLLKTFKKLIAKFVISIGLVEDIPKTRIRLCNDLYKTLDGKIKYGPMKGLSLNLDNMQWSKHDIGSILLGLYELEVLKELQYLSSKHSIFCDIGAADGIFGVGVLAANLYNKSICFEIDDIGRSNIFKLAKQNNVENRIEIYEEASVKTMASLDHISWKDACILIDIEGEEFNFINDEFLQVVNGASLIIEIHDKYQNNPSEARDKLINTLKKKYEIKTITTSNRDLSHIEELDEFHDNEKWLLCSEGRGWRMDWWVCEPILK